MISNLRLVTLEFKVSMTHNFEQIKMDGWIDNA